MGSSQRPVRAQGNHRAEGAEGRVVTGLQERMLGRGPGGGGGEWMGKSGVGLEGQREAI